LGYAASFFRMSAALTSPPRTAAITRMTSSQWLSIRSRLSHSLSWTLQV
jgi:hypothetical protein